MTKFKKLKTTSYQKIKGTDYK